MSETKQDGKYCRFKSILQTQQVLEVDTVDNSNLLVGLDKQYPIIKENFNPNPSKWTFAQLSKFYQNTNPICLSNALGVIYKHSHYDNLRTETGLKYEGDYRGSKINRILCSKFHCDRCRPLLKANLKNQMQKAITEHKLYTHFVITTEGKKYRDKNDYIRSYKNMMKAWNKISNILSYDAKKQDKQFDFICLPRAQKDGYCHLHVMTNCDILEQRLKEISQKYFNTGFIKIKSNKNVTKYLTNDFLKDHEFYIPLGRRHYTTSRTINLNIYEDIVEDTSDPEKSMHIRLQSGISVIEQIYKQIEHEYGYPPPFDFLLSHFMDNLQTVSHLESVNMLDKKYLPCGFKEPPPDYDVDNAIDAHLSGRYKKYLDGLIKEGIVWLNNDNINSIIAYGNK